MARKRIVQRKREAILMSYSDLKRWKDNFKEECYQEWLTRVSPGDLDEVIKISNKLLAEELALERRKVFHLTERMSEMETVVSGIEV